MLCAIIPHMTAEKAEGTPMQTENWAAFMTRLGVVFTPNGRLQAYGFLTEDEVAITDSAYQAGKAVSRGKQLPNGERKFEHFRNVALILMDECAFTRREDLPFVWGGLLHDIPEDNPLYGNQMKMGYERWKRHIHIILERGYGTKTADIVVALTEPKIDNIDVFTEDQVTRIKHKNLIDGPPEALIVKMADRLHKLRTFVPKVNSWEKTPEEVIQETEDVLIPIFLGAIDRYPETSTYLLLEIKKAIKALRARFSLPIPES